MRKINILLLCFFVSDCLFAQPTKPELETLIKNEITYWAGNCSYNKLSEDEVAFVVDEICGRYKDNKDVLNREVLQETTRIKDTYNIFLKGEEAINSPFDKEMVDQLVSQFSDAMKKEKEKNENRKKELNVIYQKLSEYEYAINTVYTDFQIAIDEAIKNNKGKERQAIEDVIGQQTEDGYIEYIENNPYLKGLYKAYVDTLYQKYPTKQPTQTRRVGNPRRR